MLKLVHRRSASRSRSANQKPPDAHGKTHAVPLLTGQTQASNEVGSWFELLAATGWLNTSSPLGSH